MLNTLWDCANGMNGEGTSSTCRHLLDREQVSATVIILCGSLSPNWKCLPQPPFPFAASSTRRVCPVTSPHLLGPAPGEAFTFLAFFLPLGAPAGAAWVRVEAERRRRVGPLATSAAPVGNERPLPCFSVRKPGAVGACTSEPSHYSDGGIPLKFPRLSNGYPLIKPFGRLKRLEGSLACSRPQC